MMDSSSSLDNFERINYDEQFPDALAQMCMSKYLAVDTETTGLLVKDGTDFCIGISVAGRNMLQGGRMFSYYFPVAHLTGNLSDENKATLFRHLTTRDRNTPVIFHNAKFDIFSLETAGCVFRNFFYDTLLMVHMVNENYKNKKLDFLSKVILKNDGKRKSEVWEAFFQIYGWKGSNKFPPEVMGDYATGDTELTLLLFEHFYPTFQKEGFDG